MSPNNNTESLQQYFFLAMIIIIMLGRAEALCCQIELIGWVTD